MIAIAAGVIGLALVLALLATIFYFLGIVGVVSIMVFGAIGYLVSNFFGLVLGWVIFSTILGGLIGALMVPRRNI